MILDFTNVFFNK